VSKSSAHTPSNQTHREPARIFRNISPKILARQRSNAATTLPMCGRYASFLPVARVADIRVAKPLIARVRLRCPVPRMRHSG
jgi:hypothetical protein